MHVIYCIYRFTKRKKINSLLPHCRNVSTTPLRQWGFRQCLTFSWTTLRGKHCPHPIAVMGVVDTFRHSLSYYCLCNLTFCQNSAIYIAGYASHCGFLDTYLYIIALWNVWKLPLYFCLLVLPQGEVIKNNFLWSALHN